MFCLWECGKNYDDKINLLQVLHISHTTLQNGPARAFKFNINASNFYITPKKTGIFKITLI